MAYDHGPGTAGGVLPCQLNSLALSNCSAFSLVESFLTMLFPVTRTALSAFHLAALRAYLIVPDSTTHAARTTVRNVKRMRPFYRDYQTCRLTALDAPALLIFVQIVAKVGIVLAAENGSTVLGYRSHTDRPDFRISPAAIQSAQSISPRLISGSSFSQNWNSSSTISR